MSARIHSTAIIDVGAGIADDVTIGPYCVIGGEVEIGAGTRIGAHCVVTGGTRIGENNAIYQFVSIGDAPQDKKYGGERTVLEIGNNNTIREFCTINRGTVQDAVRTRIGDDNWIMAYVHIAHDCRVGNNTVFANSTQLAGHVHVGDHAILGAATLVHQFCRIGAHSITGMGAVVLQDVPPFIKAFGNPARPYGINSEGLRRRAFSSEAIGELRRAYRVLYRSGLSLEEATAQLAQQAHGSAEVDLMREFVALPGRGIIR